MANATTIYGQTTCVQCGKKVSLSDTTWSDPKIGHICKECIKETKK